MTTGFFTFKWNDPSGEVQEVYVTGTFDAWGKSTQLFKEEDAFVARVELPVEKTQYKFVVDGEWVIDPNARKEFEDGIENNILIVEDFEGFGPKAKEGDQEATKPDDGGEAKEKDENAEVAGEGDASSDDDEGEDGDEESDSASDSSSNAEGAEEEHAEVEAVDSEAVHVEAADATSGAASDVESESSFEVEVTDPVATGAKAAEPEAIDSEGVHVEAADATSDTTGETSEATGTIVEVSEATSGVGGVSLLPPKEAPEVVEVAPEAAGATPEIAEKSLLEPTVIQEPTINENTRAGVVDHTVQSTSPLSTTAGLAALVPKEGATFDRDTKDITISSASPESTTAVLAAGVPKETPLACPYNADGTPKAVPVPKETPEACPYNADGTPKAAPIPKETPAKCPYNPDGTSKTPADPVPIPNETPSECPYNPDGTPKAAIIPKETPAGCPYNADGTPKAAPVPTETPAACPYNADGTPKTQPEEPSDLSKKGLEFFKSKSHVLMGVATIVGVLLTKRYLFSKRGG